MKHVVSILWAIMLVIISTGCSEHMLRITGQCMGSGKRIIPPGSTFYVVENNTLCRSDSVKGIRHSVMRYLIAHGFKAGTYRDADFFLAFGYGIDADKKVREPVQMATINAPYSGIVVPSTSASTPTVQSVGPGPVSMMHTHSVYEVWVVCKLIDGAAYRETKILTEIWSGKASIIENYPLPLEKTVDLMIPEFFLHICENVDVRSVVK